MVFLTDVEERHEAVFYLLQFQGILLVGVFQFDEFACRVYIVARIHAHFLGIACRHIGYLGIEMHIGHEGSEIAVGTQRGVDVFQILGFLSALCRQPHQFSAGLDDAFGLFHAGLGIVGVGRGHRLDAYRVFSPHVNGPNMDLCRFASLIIK